MIKRPLRTRTLRSSSFDLDQSEAARISGPSSFTLVFAAYRSDHIERFVIETDDYELGRIVLHLRRVVEAREQYAANRRADFEGAVVARRLATGK